MDGAYLWGFRLDLTGMFDVVINDRVQNIWLQTEDTVENPYKIFFLENNINKLHINIGFVPTPILLFPYRKD